MKPIRIFSIVARDPNTGEETLYLANGVTSVQIMWGYPEFRRMRDAFYDGSFTGPRFFVASPIMDGSDPIWPGSMVLRTPEEAREAVIQVQEQGYNAVKVYEMLAPKVYQAIMDTSREVDIKVVGDVPGKVGLHQVVEQGQQTIEHLGGYDLENLVEEVEMVAASNVWNTPTLAITNPAEFLEQSDRLGTIEVGKVADVILLTKNPLEDISHTKTLAGTMIRGTWLPMEELEEELEKLR